MPVGISEVIPCRYNWKANELGVASTALLKASLAPTAASSLEMSRAPVCDRVGSWPPTAVFAETRRQRSSYGRFATMATDKSDRQK